MRIAKVIGTVTLSRSHPTLAGGSYRLAVPLSEAELGDPATTTADPLVVYDELGAGPDTLIALSESREAAMPFHPEMKPIDAYNAAILDTIHVCDDV
ncbi:MAG: carbon dioxide concentrating mechanism protein CcmL [Planctomycetota bacterium]|nr:MAG: carbon dioxide concentrating mechanism protein CcmL [Planctomycetota bacterium]REJ94544.1 MAG: carbon dioxide concentrating mechanism protein CcmL [Planctomycetota bacterium]REK18594.1 MAG: carbon dioxide concentrating mechanism protein CcmL [Planctomycetota bacterium]REK37490.1 MAG: carbon dioxide concentrating mechanism protein CcmL [Planctomycetota bacterium]